jgi:hypothetical protein
MLATAKASGNVAIHIPLPLEDVGLASKEMGGGGSELEAGGPLESEYDLTEIAWHLQVEPAQLARTAESLAQGVHVNAKCTSCLGHASIVLDESPERGHELGSTCLVARQYLAQTVHYHSLHVFNRQISGHPCQWSHSVEMNSGPKRSAKRGGRTCLIAGKRKLAYATNDSADADCDGSVPNPWPTWRVGNVRRVKQNNCAAPFSDRCQRRPSAIPHLQYLPRQLVRRILAAQIDLSNPHAGIRCHAQNRRRLGQD